MTYKFKSTGKTIDDKHIELMFEDGPFHGITWYYEGMKFADEPNDDGTVTMTFDYQLTGEHPIALEEFEHSIGDVIINVLEEQVKNSEVVYANGTDEHQPGEVGTGN